MPDQAGDEVRPRRRSPQPVVQGEIVANEQEDGRVPQETRPVQRVPLGRAQSVMVQDLELGLAKEELGVKPILERRGRIGQKLAEVFRHPPIEGDPLPPPLGREVFQRPVQIVPAGGGGSGGIESKEAVEVLGGDGRGSGAQRRGGRDQKDQKEESGSHGRSLADNSAVAKGPVRNPSQAP